MFRATAPFSINGRSYQAGDAVHPKDIPLAFIDSIKACLEVAPQSQAPKEEQKKPKFMPKEPK